MQSVDVISHSWHTCVTTIAKKIRSYLTHFSDPMPNINFRGVELMVKHMLVCHCHLVQVMLVQRASDYRCAHCQFH